MSTVIQYQQITITPTTTANPMCCQCGRSTMDLTQNVLCHYCVAVKYLADAKLSAKL